MKVGYVCTFYSGARARHSLACVAVFALLVLHNTAAAISVFNNAVGGMAFGVANLGAPVSPGFPTYFLNVNNGRNDILTNPGIGLTASPVVANNTLSVGPVPWVNGQFVYGIENGGGNGNGPFGTGAAVITGPRFAYRLNDGGVPGGVSSSYEILSWDANFTQVGGAPVGTTGTFVSMGGRVPQPQDVALVSLRTLITGPAIGTHELPGLILVVENAGGGLYNTLALRDGLGGAATPMGGGAAIIIDNAALGTFRGLAYNVLPDLGALDGFSIPNGANFTARVTATIYSDPASIELIDPFGAGNADLLALAVLNSDGVPFPVDPLTGVTANVPEPGSLCLLLIGLIACWQRRR